MGVGRSWEELLEEIVSGEGEEETASHVRIMRRAPSVMVLVVAASV